MNNLECYNEKIFDSIKQIDEEEKEFWYARELMQILQYSKWENFQKVIKKAVVSCNSSGNNIEDHFPEVRKMVKIGSGAQKTILDYKLSRYACYLIVQNADPNKEVVALGQTYFAVQTRKMELTEAEFFKLSEDEKRLYRRKQTRDGNKILYKVASIKGVKNFDKFLMSDIKDFIIEKLLMI